MNDNYKYYNQELKVQRITIRSRFVLFGFMNSLTSHLERSPLIHSYGYGYFGHPALRPMGQPYVCSNMLPAYLSAGDRPTWLLVSSLRLTPVGACAKNLSRRFFASLPIKSKSFMQYAGK